MAGGSESAGLAGNPLVNKDDIRLRRTIAAIVRDRRNRMLMLGHNKYNMLTIPVGKVDDGEKPEDALRRELLEEVGVHARKIRLLKKFYDIVEPVPGMRLRKQFNVYDVPEWDGTPVNMEPNKHSFMKFMSDRAIRGMSKRTGREIGIATEAAMSARRGE